MLPSFSFIFIFIFFLSISIIKPLCGNGKYEPNQLEFCDDGNKNDDDGCYSNCTIQIDYNCTKIINEKSLCFENKPFSTFLYYIPLSNPFLFNISFSKPLLKDASFLKNDIFIEINEVNQSLYSWKIIESSDRVLIIEMNFRISFQSKKIKFIFNNTNNIIDVFDQKLGFGSQVLETKIPSFILYTEMERDFMNFMEYFVTIMFVIIAISFIPLAIMNLLTVFWSFLDCIQLLSLLVYIDAEYTLQVLDFLRPLKIANFHLMEFSHYLILFGNEYLETNDLPKKFKEEKLSTRFFDNASIPVVLYCKTKNNFCKFFLKVSSILIYLLNEFLTMIFSDKKSRIKTWLLKIRYRIKYSIILRTWLTIYTPGNFAFIIQMKNLQFSTPINKLESILGLSTIGFLLIPTPLIIIYILNYSNLNLEDDKIKAKFDSLYDSLHTNAILKKNFLLFYLIRKLLWPILIVYLIEDPLYQIFSLICVNTFVITLLFLKKPFKHKGLYREALLNEILVLGVLILISINVSFNYLGPDFLTLNSSINIGWGIVGLFSSIIFIKLSFLVYGIFVNVGILIVKTKKFIKILKNETSGEQKDLSSNRPNLVPAIELSSFSLRDNSSLPLNLKNTSEFKPPKNRNLNAKLKGEIEYESSEEEIKDENKENNN